VKQLRQSASVSPGRTCSSQTEALSSIFLECWWHT